MEKINWWYFSYWNWVVLGPEGPSLQLGSSIGQGVGQGFKQNKLNSRVLLATGASSGLSAAFGAPLSGSLFVLEEVFHNFSPIVWMNALAGAIASNFCCIEFVWSSSCTSNSI